MAETKGIHGWPTRKESTEHDAYLYIMLEVQLFL